MNILIFVRTPQSAERYKKIAGGVLEVVFKLAVNEEKTHVTSVFQGWLT